MTFTITPSLEYLHGHEYITRTLNLDWSFGMCLTNNLNALHRLAWAYLAPSYLLSLVLISLFLSRFYPFNRIFCRSTVVRMFWQFILFSFSSLSCTSFQLLKCIRLQPKAVFEKHNLSNWRFADDASLECFVGEHFPWAIVASVIVATFCIPLPLSLPLLHHYPTFKPFCDVYSSLYKDNRRWWCSVDLFRRLLLAAVYAAEGNPEKAHLAMMLICSILPFLHLVMWPYASSQANYVEAALLFSLSIITILSGPDKTRANAIAIEVIFFIVVSLLLVYMAWNEFTSSWWYKKRKSMQGSGMPIVDQNDDILRDPLLADQNTSL